VRTDPRNCEKEVKDTVPGLSVVRMYFRICVKEVNYALEICRENVQEKLSEGRNVYLRDL
jgi:hypothetical protein